MSIVANLWDGKNMNYNQLFCRTAFMILASISLIIISFSILLALIVYLINRKSFKKIFDLENSAFQWVTHQLDSLVMSYPLFSCLSQKDKQSIISFTAIKTFMPNETIYEKGAKSQNAYIIVKGNIQEEVGRHQVKKDLGAFLSFSNIISTDVSQTTARAMTNTETYSIRLSILKEIMDKNQEFQARTYMSSMEYLVKMNEQLAGPLALLDTNKLNSFIQRSSKFRKFDVGQEFNFSYGGYIFKGEVQICREGTQEIAKFKEYSYVPPIDGALLVNQALECLIFYDQVADHADLSHRKHVANTKQKGLIDDDENQHLKYSIDERLIQLPIQSSQIVSKTKKFEFTFISNILNGISIGLLWLGLSLISIEFPLLSGFDQIQGITATIYLLLTYYAGILLQLWRMSIFQSSKYNFIQRIILIIKQYKILLGIQLITFVSASFILPFVFDKACICNDSAYGLSINLGLKFSTQLTRGYSFDEVCKDGQLCHFYATLPQDTMHEVIFNVHVGQDVDSISIQIQRDAQYQKLPCQEFPFPKSIELRGQRRIYACLIRNLLSDSHYNVSVYYKDQILKNSTYLTIPSSDDNRELVILFGGDYGYQEKGIQLARKVVNVDPHIILIGGDVTYDNGHIHCYYSNDLFLSIFEEQFDYMYRVVPFILSVGNHDVGFNDYANYNITVSDDYGPLYFVLFPQSQDNGIIPDIKNRVTYNYHLIQNILLFGLDSGYLQTHESQVPWVKNISQQYPDFARIAHYHVAMYPTCFVNASKMEHWEYLVNAQKHWVPLFDELDFKAAFENHVHQYKRTYPLRKGQKSQQGTIYFGDGSMGATIERCDKEHKTFLEGGPFENLFETVLIDSSEHFWVLIADKYGVVKYEARSPNYDVIPNSQTQQRFFMPHDDL